MSVGNILDDFFKERKLHSAIIEGRAVDVWAEVVGPHIAQYTEDVYIRAGVLYVTISSASVRSEIYIRRRFFAQQINHNIGSNTVRNIIVR